MSFDQEPKIETSVPQSPPPKISGKITLQQAIDFGEYDPDYLATFVEWHALSRHIRWQLIRKALDIRNRQLMTQWAELNNVLNFSKKPHLQPALRKVELELKNLEHNREKLYVEYSGA